jgi:glucokinase
MQTALFTKQKPQEEIRSRAIPDIISCNSQRFNIKYHNIMKKKFIIAIDLGGTNLRIGLLDQNYKLLDKQVLNTKLHTTKEKLIAAITGAVLLIINEHGLKRSDIAGVGLGLPGPIDVDKGIVHFFPNIPGWREVRLKSILEKSLHLPVFLDNDANLMCLAEYTLGAARGSENAVCLTLGTGVGAGLIINRSLYRAKTFAAGEIGHIPINETGPKCNCGGIACVETYVGNKRIEARAKKVFGYSISPERLSALAKRGDKKAIKLWSEVGTQLGVCFVGVVNLLSPDYIVIGGGVAKAGKTLFDAAKKTILSRAMKIQARHVRIVSAKLGIDAGLIGAAILVREGI